MRFLRKIIPILVSCWALAGTVRGQITHNWITGDLFTVLSPATVASGDTLNISTGADHNFNGTAAINNGTTYWTDGNLQSGNGGSFTNNGTFNDTTTSRQFNNAFGNASATVTNNGTWNRNGTGSTKFFIPFTNAGQLNLIGGDIEVLGGGALQGSSTTTLSSGTVFYFNGNYAVNSGAVLAGAGLYQLYNGTLTVGSNLTAPNFLQTSGLLAGTPTITGNYEWRDGSWNSGGTTTIGSGGVLNITSGADHNYNATAIVNNGTVNWSNGNLQSGNGGSFTNNGTFNDTTSSRQFNNAYGNASATVTNNGTWNRNGTGSTLFYTPFTNAGQLNLIGGDIEVLGGGALLNGSTVTAAGGTVFYFNGNYAVNSGATLAGAGLFRLYNGTLTVGGNLTAPNFLQTSGLLAGTPTITGNYEWRDGSWNSGSTTIIGTAGVLSITSGVDHNYNATAIVNNGTVNWSNGNLQSGNGGSFTNNGTFNDTTSSRQFNNAYGNASATISNTGTWNRNGTGSTLFYIPFTNAGQVNLQGGDLEVLGGGALLNGSTVTAAGGTVFYFNGNYAVNSGATLAGAGLYQLYNGAVIPQNPGHL